MLRQLTTPQNSGRISGLGLAAAFIGSVGLLLVVYFGCIDGKGATRGFLQLPVGDGMNVRIAMLLAAGLVRCAGDAAAVDRASAARTGDVLSPARGVLGGYRKLRSDLVTEWHRDRNLVYYLLSAAIFRDGLAGVFTFGGVLGVNAYGISPADVLIFGVAASVVAALGAVLGGFLDDRIGSKPVIIGSLVSHHRVRADHDGLVRSPCILDQRTAVVPVHRACAGVGAHAAAAGCPATARKVWPSASTR